jgi:hypothetical protein
MRAAVYDAKGTLQGSSFVANQTTVGAQANSAMLALPGGGFVVAWQDGGPTSDGIDIRSQHFSIDNARSRIAHCRQARSARRRRRMSQSGGCLPKAR